MSTLRDELHNLPCAFANQTLLDRLGLPSDLILYIAALAIAPIETSGKFYEPSVHGQRALIIPTYRGWPPSFARSSEDEPEPPHDLIAFYPDLPGRWWWRTGSADMLGAHLISSAIMWTRPLNLVATPLAWLRARCRVTCLLDPDAAPSLLGLNAVIVTNAGHGRRIDRLLRKPPAGLPKILVRREPPHHGLGYRP